LVTNPMPSAVSNKLVFCYQSLRT